jgi:two-component system KDP operon response regulator KdpE
VDELLARIRVALRHASATPGAPPEPVFEAGELRVDRAARRVWRSGQEVHLTPTEYKLLITLIRYAGKVLTHRQLLKEVWGANYANQSHYVRVYMAQLRQKIEADPARPRLLMTEPGVGYRLRDE